MVYIIFRCAPISYAWDTSIPDGTCQPVLVMAYIFYVTNAVNIATDWFCALLPIPLLWDAPLDIKSKISVGVLLSLGVLASIAACVRQRYTSALTSARYDVADLGNIVVWGYAEVGIGFLVGSLSTLRPLLAKRNRSRYPTTHHDDDEDSEELCDRAPADSEETARTYSIQRPREDSVMSAIAKAHTKPISRTSSEYADIAERTPHETAQLSYRISTVPTQSISTIPMQTISEKSNLSSRGRKSATPNAPKQVASPTPRQTIGLAY
ncbi:hypothetical protein LTR86_003395 [Recurvomyces mirabilis]|nr:hypothetical protein LTR86_003395 [Recurvomyces mirabilis]